MNLQFQSTFKDLIVKLSWFHSVSLGFVSFRFVEYNEPNMQRKKDRMVDCIEVVRPNLEDAKSHCLFGEPKLVIFLNLTLIVRKLTKNLWLSFFLSFLSEMLLRILKMAKIDQRPFLGPLGF